MASQNGLSQNQVIQIMSTWTLFLKILLMNYLTVKYSE